MQGLNRTARQRGRGRSRWRLVLHRTLVAVWGQTFNLIQLLCQRVFQVPGSYRIHPLLGGTHTFFFGLIWTHDVCTRHLKLSDICLYTTFGGGSRCSDNSCGMRWCNIQVGWETISAKHAVASTCCHSRFPAWGFQQPKKYSWQQRKQTVDEELPSVEQAKASKW